VFTGILRQATTDNEFAIVGFGGVILGTTEHFPVVQVKPKRFKRDKCPNIEPILGDWTNSRELVYAGEQSFSLESVYLKTMHMNEEDAVHVVTLTPVLAELQEEEMPQSFLSSHNSQEKMPTMPIMPMLSSMPTELEQMTTGNSATTNNPSLARPAVDGKAKGTEASVNGSQASSENDDPFETFSGLMQLLHIE
jgi:hypothetical protein